jgi:hypothetical protein
MEALMSSFTFPALAMIVASVVTGPLAAQQRSSAPHPGGTHALNPSISLSAPATSPLQQQMQQDYASQLMATQRDLLQQNPSGTTRQELAIGNQLNSFTGPH